MGAVLNVNYDEVKRGAVFHECEMLGTSRMRDVGYDAKAAATAAS